MSGRCHFRWQRRRFSFEIVIPDDKSSFFIRNRHLSISTSSSFIRNRRRWMTICHFLFEIVIDG